MTDTQTPNAGTTEVVIDATSTNTAPVTQTGPAGNANTSAASSLPAKRMALIGLILIAIWTVHLALDFVDALGTAPLAGALFLIGVVAFYGWSSSGFDMRTTITATFVSLYLAMVAAFLTSATEREGLTTQVGDQVWEGFTWLVGVIVVSYFGATVASEAIGRFRYSQHSQPEDQP